MFFVFMLLKIEQEHYDRNTKKEKTTKKIFLANVCFYFTQDGKKKVENEHFYVFICIFAHIYSLSFCFYFA